MSAPGPKKVVIVGAGIGGLAAAVYAARQGFETEVYEQHAIVGGECTGWDRRGFHIDNCIHWMVGCAPGTDLNDLWRTVGALGEDVEVYRAECMYSSELDGERLTLWADADRTEREMIALSPEDEPEIRRMMRFCRLARNVSIPARVPSEQMGAKDALKMMVTMRDALKVFKEYEGMNVRDLMDRFTHPLIGCLISDFTPPEGLASSFVLAYGNFIAGDGGVPQGGSRAMAQRMRRRAEELGCTFHCKARVAKVVIDDGRARGIRLEGGDEVACDYVVPACDASVTFGTLLPESLMDPLLRGMYEDRSAYPVYNTFQTALAVDSPVDALGADVTWACPDLVFAEGMKERITVKSYAYEPSFAPAGMQIVQTLQGGSEDVHPFWVELSKDKEAYRAKKREIAELTRLEVERRFPEYRGKTAVLDAWTPMTYVRYCSAYKGFYQSFMVSKDSAQLPYPSAFVEGLANVVLAGQWINPPGGLPGAAITGKFAVQRICALEGEVFRA